MNPALNISTAPHVRDQWTTKFIMYTVCAALLPATLIGILVYGFHAFLVVLVSVATAVVTEYLFDRLCHKPDTWMDGSAVVTGLTLALTLSPEVPLYLPILGSFFAIFVVKCCFGGLGKNFVNPALAARCFLLISFGSAMTVYSVDGVSSATPVALLMSGRAVNITRMFLGTANGVIGSSIIALLMGGLFLWSMEIIHGEICFSILASFTLFLGLFGGQGFEPRYLLAHLCGGGVILGSFFMASDYATSPVSKLGQMVYGIFIGVLGALFRLKSGAADSFSYSVIIANLFVPLIDMFIIPKPFAYTRKAIAARSHEEKKPLLQRIPRPVLVLTAISIIAGLALSGVYAMTKDAIEEQKLAARRASYKSVCPAAEIFEIDPEVDLVIDELGGEPYGMTFGRSTINEFLVGTDAEGNIVGYVLNVTSADGFDGDVGIAIGLNKDGAVNGISFTALNETPGMGMRAAEPAFKDQFNNKAVTSFILKKSGGSVADNEIDSISGASTTSGAVVNAVNAGLDFFHTVVKGDV